MSVTAAADPKGRHKVILGSSLTNQESANQHIGLRYNFQPGTIDRSRDALLSGGPHDYTVCIPNTSDAAADHLFTGSLQATKDIDCILIYDEATSSYKLERLDGLARLDHRRTKPGAAGHRKTASLASPFVPDAGLAQSPAHVPSAPATPAATTQVGHLASSPAPPAVATPAAADDLDEDSADEHRLVASRHQAQTKEAEAALRKRTAHGQQVTRPSTVATPPPRMQLATGHAATPGTAMATPDVAQETGRGVAKVKKAPPKPKAKPKPKPKAPLIAVRPPDMEDVLDYGDDDSDDAPLPTVRVSAPHAAAAAEDDEDDDDDLDDLANMLESTLEESPPDSSRQPPPADESSEDED